MDIDEPISAEPYDPAWPTQFAGEKEVPCRELAVEPSRIEHIGSTSIVGMHAKPIVDIKLGLDRFPLPASVSDCLQAIGYEAPGEAGVPGRHYFRRRPPLAFNVLVVLFRSSLWSDNRTPHRWPMKIVLHEGTDA